MGELLNIFANHVLMCASISWLVSQLLKFFINFIVEKEWKLERLFGDGGMPSGHSATVMAMAVMTGYTCGIGSVEFGIAAIIAIIVMHDATGVRRETGKQAVTIQQLFVAINEMLSEKDRLVQKEKLKTFVGHSPIQVFFGALTGILTSVVYILISCAFGYDLFMIFKL